MVRLKVLRNLNNLLNVETIILVPQAYDPSGLQQESRALGATILK